MTTENNNEVKPVATTPIDVAALDPAIVAYFTEKEKPLAAKRDELLGQVAEFKELIEEAGGADAIRTLKAHATEQSAAAEAARLAALSKEDLLKEQDSKYAKMIGERDEKITKFQQQVIEKEVNAAITEAIASAGGNPKLLNHIVRQSVKASLDDNGDVVFDIASPDGKAVDIKGLVAALRNDDDYAAAFSAPHVSGTGTRKSADVVSVDNPWDPKSSNMTEQMKIIKADPAKAAKLAAMHGVSL